MSTNGSIQLPGHSHGLLNNALESIADGLDAAEALRCIPDTGDDPSTAAEVDSSLVFLKQLGFLDSEGDLTDRGRELTRAIDFDEKLDVLRSWRSALALHPCIGIAVKRVRTRPNSSRPELAAHIVYKSDLENSLANRRRARLLVDMLVYTDIVKDRNGILSSDYRLQSDQILEMFSNMFQQSASNPTRHSESGSRADNDSTTTGKTQRKDEGPSRGGGSLERSEQAVVQTSRAESTPMVFISHNSEDAELAESVVNLLRAALNLRANQIICTSVPGYGIPAGTETDDRLRQLIDSAGVVIGIITSRGLESQYVLFELGARWQTRKTLIPVVARDVEIRNLEKPLSNRNAIDAKVRTDLLKLVDDIASELAIEKERADAYDKYVNEVIEHAGFVSPGRSSDVSQTIPETEISVEDDLPKSDVPNEIGFEGLSVLELFASESERGPLTVSDIASDLGLEHSKTTFLLESFSERGLLRRMGRYAGEEQYSIQQPGLRLLNEHGRL